MSDNDQLASQVTPSVIVKQECDIEYETLQAVKELEAVREQDFADEIMEEIFGTQSRNDSEACTRPYGEEGTTLVIIKEEVDCDTLEGFGFQLNSIYPTDEIPTSPLRRSTRKRCQRFSFAALEESSIDVSGTAASSIKKCFAAKASLCKTCRTTPSPRRPASPEANDDPSALTNSRSCQSPAGISHRVNRCGACGKVRRRGRAPSPPTGAPYICDVCDRSFTTLQYLKRHEVTHSEERPFKCDICGRAFKRSDNLRQHRFLHTRKRQYSCNTCGKAFSQQQQLRKHERTHSGERPYTCDTCGKSFAFRDTMASHARIHTGEKPFRCDLCGWSFNQRAHLRVHLRIHKGDKPFKCGTCGRGFCRATHLKLHSRVHRKRGKVVR